jgi:hypothetical protein
MDWADEHYVKLFTRDTVTWKLWPWQAKALLPLLERKVDAAGFLPCGMHDPAAAVAAVVEIPLEVVKPGLEAMVATGTVELIGRQLLLVNFVAAQESRKTDKRKAADYREGKKAKARAEAVANISEPRQVAVTARHAASPDVTRANPSALPCSALPCSEDSGAAPPTPAAKPAGKGKPEKPPPDPRHGPMVKALTDRFGEVTGSKYPFSPRDAKAVSQLLALDTPPTVVSVWDRALRHSGFPTVRTLSELVTHFAHFLGAQARAGPDPNGGIMQRAGTPCAVCNDRDTAGIANIFVCYGAHLARAEAEAARLKPGEPWLADLAPWAAQQRSLSEVHP